MLLTVQRSDLSRAGCPGSAKLLRGLACLVVWSLALSASALTVTPMPGEPTPADVEIAFVAEGRIGDRACRPGNGTYELAVSRSRPGPFVEGETANYIWESGRATPFVLSYDAEEGIVTLNVDGTVVSHVPETSPDGLSDILLRARSTRASCGIVVRELLLDGEDVEESLEASEASGEVNTLHIAGGTLTNGFALSGIAVMTFPTRRGTPQNRQLSFEIEIGRGPAAPDPLGDEDGDGMPNGWEEEHALDPEDASDAGDDEDGDGMSNYEEYRAGTDPRDRRSSFRIGLVMVEEYVATRAAESPGHARKAAGVEWPSISNRTYSIWRATTLRQGAAGFACIATNVPADVPLNLYPDFTATNAVRYFYRVQID